MTERLFEGGGRAIVFPLGEKGKVELRRVLDRLELDIRFEKPVTGLGYIHRSSEEQEIYFFVNRTKKQLETGFSLRDYPNKGAECWNPYTGEQSSWPLWAEEGRWKGNLQLPAQSSMFLIVNN